MSYSIIRMQKMKSTAIKGIQFHNQREKESETNPDINKADSHLNYDLINGQRQIDYTEKINQVIEDNVTSGKKIRKDAVRLAEFLITSDKEFFEKISPKEQKRYFETAHEFLADRYGEKNLIYATVHHDEKTPHMHVGFVPVTEDGRLSAKDFFGQKKQLVSLQDDFNDYLKQNDFDLERGVSSSRKHVETAKYKAMTFQNMEKEAQEKYERTMGHIQEIDDKSKSIANIEAKKVLGLVGMKEQDYKSLVNYATNGVAYQLEAENLQKELDKTKAEVVQLKSEMQTGQDKVRDYYKDIRENLDSAAEKKAMQKLKQHDVIKQYGNLIEKHKGLIDEYEKLSGESKQQKQKVSDLTFQNRSYQNENRELKLENGKLKEKLTQISKEFSAFKEKMGHVLHAQLDRVKTFLRMNDVDRSAIKFLDDRQDKLVQDSLAKMEKPQREKQCDMGMER
ncbi:MobV family relaxase [Rossellomorea aquimaris]|uniref:MobV family relaxase n=1 Tax=Rossellomorea aquimaris TaxID=189382 RepID=UPI002494162D|nr:MobV family relaxase [Rossellomorea aquimaris]